MAFAREAATNVVFMENGRHRRAGRAADILPCAERGADTRVPTEYVVNIFMPSLHYLSFMLDSMQEVMKMAQAQTLINFRMDTDLKRSMEEVCRDLGMNMTTAFTIFARR